MVLVEQVLSPAPSTEPMATTVHHRSGSVLNQCFITDKANLGRREGFPSFLVCFPPKSLVQWSTFYLSPKHLGRYDVPPSDENVFFGTISRCNIFIWAAAPVNNGLQWSGEVVKQRGELYSIQLHVGIEIHIKDLVWVCTRCINVEGENKERS